MIRTAFAAIRNATVYGFCIRAAVITKAGVILNAVVPSIIRNGMDKEPIGSDFPRNSRCRPVEPPSYGGESKIAMKHTFDSDSF